MADREWQRAVLAEIGESTIGLVTLDSAIRPAPAHTSKAVHPILTQPAPDRSAPVQHPSSFGGAPSQSAPPKLRELPPATARDPARAATPFLQYNDPAPIPQPSEALAKPGAIPLDLTPGLDNAPQPNHSPTTDRVPAPAPVLGGTAKTGTPKTSHVSKPHPHLGLGLPPAPIRTDALVRRNAHGDPLVRRLGNGLRKAVGGGAAAEVRENAELHAQMTRAVSTCRQIAVISVRGGAGKTTIAALAASAIGEMRNDRVLAFDADPHLGSLPLRLGVRGEQTVHELASAGPRSWEETSRYLVRARKNVWVLPASHEGRILADLDLDTFRTAFGGLGRFFSTALIDCAAGVLGALQRGILETSHAQLLVTPDTVDGALSTRGALDWFAANGNAGLLQRTVIVVVTHTPHADADLDRVRKLLGTGGLPVIHLPYDRHVATGASLDASRLAATTRTAATRIAAEVFARSTGV